MVAAFCVLTRQGLRAKQESLRRNEPPYLDLHSLSSTVEFAIAWTKLLLPFFLFCLFWHSKGRPGKLVRKKG